MKSIDYHRPRSLDEAWRLADSVPGARFVAGGTDVMVGLKNKALRPGALISLRAIPGLARMENGTETRIGALATIGDIAADPVISERYPVLVQACRRLGSAQVRNVATVGGNLCNASPCADTAPPLLVLEARVRIEGPSGKREMALDEFFRAPGETRLSPGEVLTEVVLPPPAPAARGVFFKLGRVHMDLAKASVAALVEMDGKRCKRARFAAGSVAPVPLRLREVEKVVEGAVVDDKLIARAQEAAMKGVSPITDIRSTAEYRRQIVGVFVRRAIEALSKVGV
ncbi:MAG: xanthine dehydrogenase family protein subunit M [Deltaproteobacteria bacterium]|nr:xanthine dehydrogenase family protein subunit M [Deltaproteobacteria bacterium]